MNVAELIRELYKFQPDIQVVLLNDEFAEFFTPTTVTKHEFGVYERKDWHPNSWHPKLSIRGLDYQPEQYKLINKSDYVRIG